MLRKFLTLRGMLGGIGGSGNDTSAYIIEDDAGNSVPAVLVDEETLFTATANDIREGMVAATESGVTTGTKEIPLYVTSEGFQLTPAGSAFSIRVGADKCEFTKLQVLICAFGNTLTESVATEKVSINGNVYAVGSTEILATVVSNVDSGTIDLGITNEGDTPCVIRYFTYKEEP